MFGLETATLLSIGAGILTCSSFPQYIRSITDFINKEYKKITGVAILRYDMTMTGATFILLGAISLGDWKYVAIVSSQYVMSSSFLVLLHIARRRARDISPFHTLDTRK